MSDDYYRITDKGMSALEEIKRRASERGISEAEAVHEIEHELYEKSQKEHAERLARTPPEVLAEIRAGRLTWAEIIRAEKESDAT